MTFEEYGTKAISTAKYPRGLSYPVLGLVGEIGEFVEKQFADDDELGDIYWYCNAVAYELNTSLQAIGRVTRISKNPFKDLVINVGKLAEIAKKALRDNHGMIQESKIQLAKDSLSNVIGILNEYADDRLEMILESNINKLFDRKKRNVISGDGDNR